MTRLSQTAGIPGAGDFRSSEAEPNWRFFIGLRGPPCPVRGPYSDLGFLGNSTL